MELAAAAFTSLTSALTAGGGAAAGAAGTGAGLFGGASSWLSVLQLGMAGLSGAAALGAGAEKADSLNSAAADAETQAGNELITGQERRSSMKRAAAEKMAERQQAYAAGGVDLSFGTPAIAQSQDARDAEHALAIDQGTQDQNVARLNERAGAYRRAAKSARSASYVKAFMTGADAALSTGRRGFGSGASSGASGSANYGFADPFARA